MGLLKNENAISSGGYQISNSLRFQSASSTYANRTPASAGNRQKWTWSAWVKRGGLTTPQFIMFSATSGSGTCQIGFQGSGNDGIVLYDSSLGPMNVTTTPQYRDPSAWYHIVIAVDTTQATAANRVLMYVNGVQVTAFSTATYPSQNANTGINNNVTHGLGTQYSNGSNAGNYFDGYMAEVNFIDGQALTPSSFGSTDPTSGQWVAAKYAGTYGTNGFYLPFSNGTSTTTLGADSSGNSNNWTLTNFTRSAGVSDCWMYDVPSGNGGVSGTQPNSNYAVLNPLLQNAWWAAPSRGTITNGNLTFPSQGNVTAFCNWDVVGNVGKWYYEMTCSATDAANSITISAQSRSTFEVTYYQNGNKQINGGSASAYGASWTSGDVIGVAIDAANNTITFYKNNTSQGTITNTFPSATVYAGAYYNSASGAYNFNFGQRSFSYTPPTGFKALCTANLPVATIKQGSTAMNINLYTGDGTNPRTISGLSFSPDFVWVKNRSAVADHVVSDKLITDYSLFPSTTGAAVQGYIKALGTNSFDVGNPSNVNGSGNSMVAWYWKAGGTGVSNTNGSITSTTSVNATAGFSVVTYTGTGANATVGHGLGVAPKMVIVKRRDTVGYNWYVYNSNLTNASYYLTLNVTAAAASDTTLWNSTAPTSSVFSLGNNAASNASTATYVAYCFAEIAGFSKFGSYTGNGSADGSFVYTGFRPKYVMMKCSSTTGNWEIIDATRSAYNTSISDLSANTSSAEVNVSTYGIDILSNGFKLRTADATINGSGSTYIYMAFAESPFQNSNSR